MIRQLCYILFLALLFTGCKTEEEIQAEAEKLAQEEFKAIDITRVDRYPLFENCDEMLTTPDCFYAELHQLITEKLHGEVYYYSWSSKDSLVTSITVKSSGQLQYDSIVSAAGTVHIKALDSIFRERLYPLCKIEPAILQGIPVTTSYRLPIKITALTTPID
jgi:PBP1b-binding outer membrane lipoprotein LpoB